MTDLSITDFLTARYDEAEAPAQREVDLAQEFFGDARSISLTYQWARTTRHISGGRGSSFMPGAPSPTRVLADIAAKRRILQKAMTYEPLRDHGNPTANAAVVVAKMIYDVVLRELASVYSDHPDFNPDWRVES